MTGRHAPLADRIRAALAAQPLTREVSMFGGRSFMVNARMVVASGRDDDLLVRVDPKRSQELLALPGAGPAEMGAGRAMGPGWIRVAGNAITTKQQLSFWIDAALEHNAKAGEGDR